MVVTKRNSSGYDLCIGDVKIVRRIGIAEDTFQKLGKGLSNWTYIINEKNARFYIAVEG